MAFLISIHAPREGSDPEGPMDEWRYTGFLSTLPARGATSYTAPPSLYGAHFYPRSPRGERPFSLTVAFQAAQISIHAPREGSD